MPRRRVEATEPRRSEPPRHGVAWRPSEGRRHERGQIRAGGNEAGGIPVRRRPLRETLAVGFLRCGCGERLREDQMGRGREMGGHHSSGKCR